MVIFVLKAPQFSMNFHDNPKNKNQKIDFSFDSAHCTSFIKMGAKLRGGGLYILSWEKPNCTFSIDLASSGSSQEVECGSILARIPEMR